MKGKRAKLIADEGGLHPEEDVEMKYKPILKGPMPGEMRMLDSEEMLINTYYTLEFDNGTFEVYSSPMYACVAYVMRSLNNGFYFNMGKRVRNIYTCNVKLRHIL